MTAKLFQTRLYPAVQAALKADGGQALTRLQREYIGSDAVMPKLELGHPGEQVFYPAEMLHRLYATIGVQEEQVVQALKDTPVVENHWKHLTKPQYWASLLGIKWMVDAGRPE